MAVNVEAEEGAPLPFSAPAGFPGSATTMQVPATTASQILLGRSVYLAGWSFRETTGTAPAIIELFDGATAGGVFLGAVDLTGGSLSSVNQTPASTSSSGANAALAPAIGGGAGLMAFVQSITITGLGATVAAQVTATLTGLLGGTISYPLTVPAGATVPITNVFDGFGSLGIQASAVATAITLNLPAFGAGNTLAEAALNGYTQASPTPSSAAAGGSSSQWFGYPGLLLEAGLFMNMISGSVKGAIWYRV